MANLSVSDTALLKTVVDATNANSFVSLTPAATASLVAAGLVETNPQLADASGIATRATPAGIARFAPAPVAAAPGAKPAIDTNVALPAIVRRGGFKKKEGAEKWPFDELTVNASFHVAPVEGKDMARVMAAAVSNANAKYSVKTGETETVEVETYQVDDKGKRVKVNGHFVKTGKKSVTRDKTKKERDYVLRSVGADDPRGAGIRVFRTL